MMWGYYGSKSKVVDKYPSPKYDKIIEPFAGTAQYSLKYFEKEVLLVDKYEVITRVWQWLQKCSKKDILSLPRLKWGENVDNFTWDCDEAKWLIGFIIVGAPSQPKKTASRWKTVVRPNTQEYKLNLIADSLYKIRHWKVIQGDYKDIENEKATWFIDPPYELGGQYYKYSNKDIDYKYLLKWSKSRLGESIVCENSNATWIKVKPIAEMRGNKLKSTECMAYYTLDNKK